VLRTELLELIRNGENSGVEFKRDVVENWRVAKELVAFANAAGGSVLLGVEDDGSVSGITRANVEEWVMQLCRDKIRPEIIPYYQVVRDVEPGRDVAIVRVSPGYAVHHLWHENRRTYYIRVGSTCREASVEELERLFQQRGGVRGELRPVSGTTWRDLDRRRLTDYFGRVREQSVPDDEDEWVTLLPNAELLASSEGPAPSANVAALLLFGDNVNRFLPQAGIDAVAYPGLEKDYTTVERATLRGPMTPLHSAAGDLVENGLVEQALAFVQRNAPGAATLDEGGRRIERTAFPREAVREAVVNALIHRDYLLSSTDVELSLYSDRLEVISPGRLPNGITPERMRVGCRAARNQLLKDVMRDYRYLEHMGMGVPRKIIRLMREQNGTEPELVADGEQFAVRLWKAPR